MVRRSWTTSEAPSVLSRSAFSAVDVVAITPAPKSRPVQSKDRDTPETLGQHRVSRGNPPMPPLMRPRLLPPRTAMSRRPQGEMTWHVYERFLAEHRRSRQHPVEIGAEAGRSGNRA